MTLTALVKRRGDLQMTTPSLTESEKRRIMRDARQEEAINHALDLLRQTRTLPWNMGFTCITSAIVALEEVSR